MKNLIYYLIYSEDKLYQDFLISSINTLIKKGNYRGDILFIIDDHNKDFILNINIPNRKYIMYLNDIKILALNKFKIYQFEHINNYDNILYIDTDILINNDINPIFDNLNNNIFNFSYDDRSIDNCIDKKLIENKKMINSGLFLFKKTKQNLLICKKIFSSIEESERCLEQPIVNKYFLFNENKYNDNLTEFVYFNYNKDFCDDKNKIFIHILMHHPLSPGFINLYEKMINNDILFNDIIMNFDIHIIYDMYSNKIYMKSKYNNYNNLEIIINMNDKKYIFNDIILSNDCYTYLIPPFKIDNNFDIIIKNGKYTYYRNNIICNSYL